MVSIQWFWTAFSPSCLKSWVFQFRSKCTTRHCLLGLRFMLIEKPCLASNTTMIQFAFHSKQCMVIYSNFAWFFFFFQNALRVGCYLVSVTQFHTYLEYSTVVDYCWTMPNSLELKDVVENRKHPNYTGVQETKYWVYCRGMVSWLYYMKTVSTVYGAERTESEMTFNF